MKTRIIHTKIWKDGYFSNLNRIEKLVFIYLLTNENVNMCGMYELSDREIIFWTGIKSAELERVKERFMTDNKVIFYNGWVKLVNHNRYNSYGKGEKQDKAFKREMQFVPAFLKDYNINNTSIDTSIYTRHKSKYIIHKTKNIKREKKIKKEIHDLLVFFNLKYKTNYSSPRSLVNNYTYWKEQYTLEQMKRAITRSLADSWWRGRLTPEMLLRRKNLRNEDVDYIGKFLGMRLTKKKAAEATEEMIKEGLIEGGDEN